jgi:hypothetical protein
MFFIIFISTTYIIKFSIYLCSFFLSFRSTFDSQIWIIVFSPQLTQISVGFTVYGYLAMIEMGVVVAFFFQEHILSVA